jgi:hypothetical protein
VLRTAGLAQLVEHLICKNRVLVNRLEFPGRPAYVEYSKNVLRNAALAQLVEHLICNQGVAGSSPAGGTSVSR